MINNIKLAKTAIICLFVLISISIILSYIVFGGTATGSFLIGQNAPNDPTVMLQQADSGCGGDLFDTTTTNLTTHMLNATLNWTESDSNGDSVWTFICIATTRERVDNANSTNKSSGDGCNVINFWNWSIGGPVYGPINDSALGIRLNNASGGSAVDYNGDKNVYYGTMMAYDNQSTSNTSNKVYFNITILNNIPGVSGFNTTATHKTSPNLGWNYQDLDDGSAADKCPRDPVNFSIYIGSAVSGNGSFVHQLNNITGNYSWIVSPLNWNSTVNNGWSNETYYYRINVTDFHTGTVSTNSEGTFYLYDNLPTVPFGFNTTQTHNQSMHVAWNGGTETDGDTVTYSITAGTTVNGTDILAYTTQATSNKSDNFFATTISWNHTANLGYANTSVFMVIGAYDSASGIRRNNYTASFMLYDALPDVIDVYMSDNNVLSAYTNCSGNKAACTFNPVSGTNITLAVNITTSDVDNDCDAADYKKPNLILCLNSTNLAGCGDNTNNNFTIPVEAVSRRGSVCEWKFNNNLTNITPQFFIPVGNYKYSINATSQSGTRTMIVDNEMNSTWVYSSLQSVDFPSSITVGDGSIQLETWNPGMTNYQMTNYGNTVVYTQWNSTNFTRAGASVNWTLRGWDFLLDDDSDQSLESTGKIFPINLTENPGGSWYFNYSTGLQLCITKECNAATLNETMDTYWHIYPITGLGAGTYSATITYIVKTS